MIEAGRVKTRRMTKFYKDESRRCEEVNTEADRMKN